MLSLWLRDVLRIMLNIYNETFCENSYGLEAINRFCKKVAGPQFYYKETSTQLALSEVWFF